MQNIRLAAQAGGFRGVRLFFVREYARLHGVPDTFTFAGSDNDAYRMIGNGVSVPVGKWIGSEITRYFQ
jgi:DNA (cytosine-5)-methyltransferase 1